MTEHFKIPNLHARIVDIKGEISIANLKRRCIIVDQTGTDNIELGDYTASWGGLDTCSKQIRS